MGVNLDTNVSQESLNFALIKANQVYYSLVNNPDVHQSKQKLIGAFTKQLTEANFKNIEIENHNYRTFLNTHRQENPGMHLELTFRQINFDSLFVTGEICAFLSRAYMVDKFIGRKFGGGNLTERIQRTSNIITNEKRRELF